MSEVVGFDGTKRVGRLISPSMLSSPPFFPVESRSKLELRRDSTVSLQSPMRSLVSGGSDYSVPVTPTYGHSPIADGDLSDVMYDPGHGQAQLLDGLPVVNRPKVLGSDQEFIGYWPMLQQCLEENQHRSVNFQAQNGFATMGGFPHAPMVHHANLETTAVTMMEDSWNISTPTHQDIGQHWHHHLDDSIDIGLNESQEVVWVNQIQPNLDIQTQAMIHSNVVPRSIPDCVHVGLEQTVESDPVEESPGRVHQPLQEIRFKREDFRSRSRDYGDDWSTAAVCAKPRYTPGPISTIEGTRVLRSTNTPPPEHEIRISSTGGKRVCRTKKPSPTGGKRAKKSRKTDPTPQTAYKVTKPPRKNVKDVECWPRGENWCPFEDCKLKGKRFQRKEHLHRHLKTTHSGEAPFFCRICLRCFNRNDNCNEHYKTHNRISSKKPARNQRVCLREIESFICDPVNGPKIIAKLRGQVGAL